MSFRREKYIPKGGPDGGDGGDGGNVYALAAPGTATLLDFSGRHHWIAKNGQPGRGKNMSGRTGDDLTLQLPAGTLIYDRDTGVLIKDLSKPGKSVCIAQGGKGGKGNARFARATNQTPRTFEEGTPGQERWLNLELKLIADVGIVGVPNAGKSTLLSRLSKAHPKIADYPFPTRRPQLGIVALPYARRVVIADIPGLIEGAHEGAGLGDEFLRHIERTRTILHVIAVGSDAMPHDPGEAYRVIRGELTKYSPELAAKEEIIVGNKIDLTGGKEAAKSLAQALQREVVPVSAVSGEGLDALTEMLWATVAETVDAPEAAPETILATPPHKRADG